MLGLALGLAFLTGFGIGPAALVFWVGLGALLLSRKSISLVAVAAVVVAAGLGAMHANASQSPSDQLVTAGSTEGTYRVSDGPFLTQSGQRFLVRADRRPGILFCAYANSTPKAFVGDRIFVAGRISLLDDLSQIGQASARSGGCDAQLRIESMQIVESGSGLMSGISHFRVELSEFLMRGAPGDVGALLSGLVTGDDGGLTQNANDAFRNSGTTHITAISGANFAILTVLLGLLVSGSLRRSLGFVFGASIMIWLYALMVGLQPSALRAALLATAVLVGRWVGRHPDLLTLTVLLAAFQVVVRPNDSHTLAFQLSVAATVALIVVFDGNARDGQPWLVTLALSVLAAQLATLPILARELGAVSGIGLFANFVVGPMAALAFPVALAASLAGQIDAPLGEMILLPATVLSHAILIIVEWSDRHVPGALQFGPPTWAVTGTIAGVCWLTIVWLSGDLRRMSRHWLAIARQW